MTQNLAEVLGGDQLKAILDERDLIAYWGTAPTGRRTSSLSHALCSTLTARAGHALGRDEIADVPLWASCLRLAL